MIAQIASIVKFDLNITIYKLLDMKYKLIYKCGYEERKCNTA